MENIFIFLLLPIMATSLTTNATLSIQSTAIFNSINESLVLASISYSQSIVGNNNILGIDKSLLMENVKRVVEANKSPAITVNIQYDFYYITPGVTCVSSFTPCNGTIIDVRTNLKYFYTHRRYQFEIVSRPATP